MTTPRCTALAALVALIALTIYLRVSGDVPRPWEPRCPLFSLTGLHCAGCGITRFLHALAHGEFRAALHNNALFALALPVIAAWGGVALWRGIVRNKPPAALDALLPAHLRWEHWARWRQYVVLGALILVVIAFSVLRNISREPFSWLAPLP